MTGRRRAAAAIAALALALPAGAETSAIVGATIYTLGAAGKLEHATLVMRDGKIVAAGPSVAVPPGATRIDGAGKIVTPGLFDPMSRFGVEEVSGVKQTRDDAAKGKEFTAALDMGPVVNPGSVLIPVNRIAGVTAAMVAPSVTEGGTIIAGSGAVITLAPSERPVLKDPAAMFVTLGEAGSELSGGSRAAALLHLREALQDARDFIAHRADYDAARRRPYVLGRLDLAALEPVLKREIPLVAAVDRASDIRAVLALAREFDLRLTVSGGAEAWMVAADLAAARVPVILDPLTDLPAAFESLGATLQNAARLARAGVVIAFETGDSHNARNLTQLAGNAVAAGLPYEDALKAISANPARICGMGDRLGTIEAGKDADVVMWSGDPLELTSAAEAVFVRGVRVPMVSRQTLLRDRYLAFERGKTPRAPAYPPAAKP